MLPSTPPHYTLFIRLPFNRNGFEDPAPVEWDEIKDKALWKIISKANSSRDLDWEELSGRFGVALGFLVQQAAWLYERHFEGMRMQMRKLGGGGGEAGSGSGSGSGSAVTAVGGLKMERTGSGGRGATSTTTAARRESPLLPLLQPVVPVGQEGSPGSISPRTTPRPAFSRTPSTATVTQSKLFTSFSARKQHPTPRTSSGSGRRPAPPILASGSPRGVYDEHAIEHEGASASDSEDVPARSHAFRRPATGKKAKPPPNPRKLSSDADGDAEPDDEDDDSEQGGFLPFAGAAPSSGSKTTDPSAILRSSPRRQTQVPNPLASRAQPSAQPTATTSPTSSSASSAPPAHALSPRHRAHLAAQTSDGSPSMGSSFSDLDDVGSVTKSALEEALLSNVRAQGGSVASVAGRVGRGMGSLREVLGRRAG